MSVLALSDRLIGPFRSIELIGDRLVCDGFHYPLSVIAPYSIIEDDPPGPASQYDWNPEASEYSAKAPTPPLSEVAVANQLAAGSAEYEVRRQNSMPWDFGDILAKDDDGQEIGPAGLQTLQMRDDGVNDDLKNWLSVVAVASAAVGAGRTDAVLPLKTADNLWIQTTAAEVVAVLTVGVEGRPGLLARQSLILARYGALKRQIADAADLAALDAIDLAAGWPS